MATGCRWPRQQIAHGGSRASGHRVACLDAACVQGVGFRSLKGAWCDTTTPHGRLMLTVLGGLAEFERELIRARTGEGRKRAKEAAFGSAARARNTRLRCDARGCNDGFREELAAGVKSKPRACRGLLGKGWKYLERSL